MNTARYTGGKVTAGYGAGATGLGRRGKCSNVVAAAAAATASRAPDYYKVLSLERTADVGAEEVKRAYRRLALQCHPDVCPPSRRAESTELFVELRRAYETLSDPATRVQYDAELRTGQVVGGGRRPSSADGFARDVWEAQLSVLRARSERRQKARRCGSGGRRERCGPGKKIRGSSENRKKSRGV